MPPTTVTPASSRGVKHRFRWRLVLFTPAAVLVLFAASAVVTTAPAQAVVRLGNGAYGSYSLDCSGFHTARLQVQGGVNGIPVQYYRYWLYSVDQGRYVVSGAWVDQGSGWASTTITVTQTPGRYQVYVEYWSLSGGYWYSGGEWTWATNLLQPTTAQVCTVL
jgi:hypothetical protein